MDYGVYDALKLADAAERAESRVQAAEDFLEAMTLATQHGLTLACKSSSHYQLTGEGGWLINVYPGNHRLYWDRNRPKPPYLKVPPCWTLVDVVNAAIEVSDG